MTRLVEIRTYRLKPGTMPAFLAIMKDQAIPLLRKFGMDVVAYGQSNHEEETCFLARAYTSREALEKEQTAFYGSSEWRLGPRADLVQHIDTYLNTLLWMSDDAVASMRLLNVE